MSQRLALLLSVCFAIAIPRLAEATSITVLNYSFELPVTTIGYEAGATDWVFTANSGLLDAGVFDPAQTSSLGAYFNQALPDGNQTVFSNYGDIHQVLGAALTADQTYTLTVAVGDRKTTTSSNFTVPSHAIQLRAGGNILASNSGAPADGYFVDVTTAYTADAFSPGLGSPLEIWLVNNDVAVFNGREVQINYDNVRLTAVAAGVTAGPDAAVPEPATLTLLGLGLAGIAARRHRRS